jgi:mono/diheme cytochrome c family protein/uncharacterized membrane protein
VNHITEMKYFPAFLAFLLLLVAPHAQAAPAPSADAAKTAAEVYRIFEAKCADCHGAHLSKPKGKFGYILDLGRVGANVDYVVPRDLQKSDLYRMVKENEMPGEDADVPPLTPEELAVVAKWIADGAPGHVPPTNAVVSTTAAPPPSAPFFTRALAWLGKFHPASTHFPVALLLTAVVAELLAWWLRKPEWTLVVRFLVILGALSAIPTTLLGWFVSFPTVSGSATATVYQVHRILGTTTAIWGVVCAVLICMAECEEGSFERKRFRGALFFGALLVSVTGMLGGMLTFGVNHYAF